MFRYLSPSLLLPTLLTFVALAATPAQAHHSSNLYHLDQFKSLRGVITDAYFGRPHSRYQIEVTNRDGTSEIWTVIVQDPEDAERFGYYDQVASISEGDEMTFIGWPHSRNEHEILAHIGYIDGSQVELVPPGGYIRHAIYLAMDQRATDPSIRQRVAEAPAELTEVERLYFWARNNDPIDRAAVQEQKDNARLIGVIEDGEINYLGAPAYLLCQADTRHAEIFLAEDLIAGALNQNDMNNLVEFIQIHNRVLSKYWELAWNSCGA